MNQLACPHQFYERQYLVGNGSDELIRSATQPAERGRSQLRIPPFYVQLSRHAGYSSGEGRKEIF